MNGKDIIDLSIKGITAVLALLGAYVALRNLRITVRTKTSEFLLALHKSFFTEDTYKTMRYLLDDSSDTGREEIMAKISQEADDLIRFLNFFEMVFYMRKTGAFNFADVDALLGYYLNLLNGNIELSKYIGDNEKSFEHLAGLLKARQTIRGATSVADQLFVYGTLHPDHAPAEIRDVVAQLRFAGEGTIEGRRYELGEYPAVLPAKNSVVSGSVFTLPEDSGTLRKLDAYEEYDRDAPEKSLFLRRKATVTFADGRRTKCWVYFYNRMVPEQLLKLAS